MSEIAPDELHRAVGDEFTVHGLHVYRTAVNYRRHEEAEEGVRWALSPALSESHDLGVMGDLTVRSARMFSGVQVLCFLDLPWREEPLGEADWPLADEVLKKVAPRLTHALYDFAALAMRSSVAGFSTAQRVPRSTPDYTLMLAGDTEGDPVQHELAQDD